MGGSQNSGGGSSAAGSVGGSQNSGGSSSAGATSSGPTGGGASRDAKTDKVDLLFVVDNSIGMADKQAYLTYAAGELIESLVYPPCVDADAGAGDSEYCPEGQAPAHAAVRDLHVGVITSSLGGHGGDICTEDVANFNTTKDDGAKLIGSVRDVDDNLDGFVEWVSEDGDAELEGVQSQLWSHLVAVGDVGCGYEAPLEAMYRFLIEPTPPVRIVVESNQSGPERDSDGNVIVDQQLLEQRAAFLRPDSALVVVLLSDENDCSIKDQGHGYLAATSSFGNSAFQLPRATSACDSDPNDPCCRSCGLAEEQPPDGCTVLSADPNCQAGVWSDADSLNLRCFETKRRFGLELLYPVERYVAGLTERFVPDTHGCQGDDCPLLPNPLFPDEDPEREFTRRASEVFVLGLVGVPWQDLATDSSLQGDELSYRSSISQDTWDLIVGDPSNYVAAEDPLMIESVDARSGEHPVTGEAVASEKSLDPTENSSNGHEFINNRHDQLQYACIFPLETPRDCRSSNGDCRCTETDIERNDPLCQPREGGAATTTQFAAAATPGLRQLEVLSALPRGVPASICPKVIDGEPHEASFGYNPAMRALIQQLASVLK